MKLNGKHTFDAPPEEIYTILMDTEALARITPGITKLEETDTDQYDAIADVKIGPVSGSFKGKVKLTDKRPNEGFSMSVSQNSKIGNVNADVHIHLEPTGDEQTQMSFEGLAKMSGLLARTGQRVLSGVASTLTKQFFSAMEDEIKQRA